jgi:hypothetical protein
MSPSFLLLFPIIKRMRKANIKWEIQGFFLAQFVQIATINILNCQIAHDTTLY